MPNIGDINITAHYIILKWHWTWMDGQWVRYVDKLRLEYITVKE